MWIFLAVIFAMQAQLPVMQKQFEATGKGGVITNTASVAGPCWRTDHVGLCRRKTCRCRPDQGGRNRKRPQGYPDQRDLPCLRRTDMVTKPIEQSPHGAEKAEARLISNIPMGRMGEIDEIVQAMMWVSDPENSFYTGQALALDGGLSAVEELTATKNPAKSGVFNFIKQIETYLPTAP